MTRVLQPAIEIGLEVIEKPWRGSWVGKSPVELHASSCMLCDLGIHEMKKMTAEEPQTLFLISVLWLYTFYR